MEGGSQEYPVKLNQKCNIDEQRAIHVAVEDRNMKVVVLLLEHHADPNLTDRQQQNCLHYVGRTGHLGLARLLLANRCDYN